MNRNRVCGHWSGRLPRLPQPGRNLLVSNGDAMCFCSRDDISPIARAERTCSRLTSFHSEPAAALSDTITTDVRHVVVFVSHRRQPCCPPSYIFRRLFVSLYTTFCISSLLTTRTSPHRRSVLSSYIRFPRPRVSSSEI